MIEDLKYFFGLTFTTGLWVYVLFLVFGSVSPSLYYAQVDSLSVANNFMVFVTIIIAISTIILTIAGLSFTKWYSREKLKIIEDNMSEVVESIIKDEKLRKYLISEISKNQSFKVELDNFLNDFSSTQLKEIQDNFEAYKNKMDSYIQELIKNLEVSRQDQEGISKFSRILENNNG